ncbi:MAG: choice-of-anchor D domain-containing protein, partial [Candidatus Thiodiazotropha sp.]
MSGLIRYLVVAGLALFSMSASAVYSIDPASIAFGSVVVGTTSGTRTVTFSNLNTTDAVEFTTVSATGPFTVTNNCPMLVNDLILNAMTSCTIDISYSPQTYGISSGTLTVAGLDVGGGAFNEQISLSGSGVMPPRAALEFGSAEVDLGDVSLNTPSSPVDVILSNSGTVTASISAISATAPFTQTNDCPSTLAAGQSCTVQLSVTSDTLGDVTGTLLVTGADSLGSLSDSVALSAVVQAGMLVVSDTTLAFDDTVVGESSASRTLTISNPGNVSLTDLAILLEGGDFSSTNNCPASLGAGASCTVTIAAVPTTPGDLTGALSVSAMSGGAPVSESVTLSVHAVDPANGSDLVPSVSILDFPDTTVDAESQPQTLILTNPGSVAVTLNGISTEGDFTQTNTCGATLAAGASCEIQITFLPRSEGTLSGTLNIDTNTGINRIALSGNAAIAASNNPVADLLDPYTGGNPNLESLAQVIGEACPSGRLGDQLQADCNAVVGAAIGGDPNTARALQQVVPESATKANNVSRQGGETQVRN